MTKPHVFRHCSTVQAAVGLCWLGMLAVMGCSRQAPGGPVPETTVRPTVEVVRLARTEGAMETRVFFGKLVPQREVRLGFSSSGQVRSIVEVNTRVTVEQELGALDDSVLQLQRQGLEQQLANYKQPVGTTDDLPRRRLTQQLKELDQQLEQLRITAPFDGVVASVDVEVGTQVRQGLPILHLLSDGPPEIQLNLPRRIAQVLPEGQLLRVLIGEQSLQCRLDRKAIQEQPSGSLDCWLVLDQEQVDAGWTYGQAVEVRFVVPNQRVGFWVPLSALQGGPGGLWSVLRIEPEANSESAGELQRRTVDVLQVQGAWVLVQGQLESDDWILADGGHRVVVGQAVQTRDVSAAYTPDGALEVSE